MKKECTSMILAIYTNARENFHKAGEIRDKEREKKFPRGKTHLQYMTSLVAENNFRAMEHIWKSLLKAYDIPAARR